MTSSKVVNLPRDPSLCSFSALLADLHHHNTNTNMDELLKSIYPSSSASDPNFNSGAATTTGGGSSSISGSKEMDTKTVDDVWKEIVAGNESQSQPQMPVGSGAGAGEVLEEMTLEDFLTKAGAVRKEDVRGVPAIVAGPGGYGGDAAEVNGGAQFAMPAHALEESSVEAFGNGIEGTVVGRAAPGGKGKRRVMEEPLDKAALQKQRRMIKNRESAARSRERKQAYTVELEYLVTQLEEENARLLKEEADKNKQRFKQLMECLIPVVEKRKPRRMLRRANSVQW